MEETGFRVNDKVKRWLSWAYLLDKALAQPKPKRHFPITDFLCKFELISIEQIAAEALRLPPQKRAFLVEALWESLADPHESDGEQAEADSLSLAAERDRQVDYGEVKPVSHDEMMKRLRP